MKLEDLYETGENLVGNQIPDDICESIRDEVNRIKARPEADICEEYKVDNKDEALILCVESYHDGSNIPYVDFVCELQKRKIIDFDPIEISDAVYTKQENENIRKEIEEMIWAANEELKLCGSLTFENEYDLLQLELQYWSNRYNTLSDISMNKKYPAMYAAS